MGVKPQVKKILFLFWIFVVPAGMWFTYQAFPPQNIGHWWDIFAFLALTSVVASMPMVINNTPIFLIQWVTLAAFLTFGLFVEMALTQLSVVVLLLRLRIQKDQYFRFPLNFNMFFLVSILSGLAYYALGGKTGTNLLHDTRSLWLAALYAVLGYSLNQVIISFHFYFVYRRKGSFFGTDFVWETVTSLITVPIGFILYILYYQMGVTALFIVGIPFASLSMILLLYYSSQKINEQLQKAAEIGHQMAEQLKVNDVIDFFIQKFGELLPVDYSYIYRVTEDREFRLVRQIDDRGIASESLPRVNFTEGIAGLICSRRKSIHFTARKQWGHISNGFLPNDAESLICVPIFKNKEIIGGLLLASRRKYTYEKSQLMIVDLLCSYFAVALENARNYELTKMQSERCSLTKLYNYRYFENLLSEEFDKLYYLKRNCLSLIILDIDHFKSVNDTYGHQAGNEILIELAERLKKMVEGRGTVARYGGEEFVVLLPEVSKEAALELAEMIRQSIANWPFTITHSLDQEKNQQVKITASIGIATAPDDAEDPLSLIRHADRALYVGAKRAGRNRVAEYSTC